MGEERYCSVNLVRKLISEKVGTLHGLLDERKLTLNEELDQIEAEFAVENQKNEEELIKLTSYKDQTFDIFKDTDTQNDTRLLKIESRINELNNLRSLHKVRLKWNDDRVRRELGLLGELETPETRDEESINPDIQQKDESINPDLQQKDEESINRDIQQKDEESINRDIQQKDEESINPDIQEFTPSAPRKEDIEADYEIMGKTSTDEPLTPISEVCYYTVTNDRRDYSNLSLGGLIESKEFPKEEKNPVYPKSPVDYLIPVRKSPSHGMTTPPIPAPRYPEKPAKFLKQSVGNILDTMKRTKIRTNPETKSSDQELEIYGEVQEQKQVWQHPFRKKSGSVGDMDRIGTYPTPLMEDTTVINKCTMGKGPGQLLKPKNVAVSTKTGCIFVAEKGNNRVQVFTKTGDPLFSFGQRTKGLSMKQPYGVCILNEKVYVSQSESNCVMVFKTNGDYCMQGGQQGKSEGCFNFPAGLCTDGTSLLVCDFGNNRIQVLSNNLIYKHVFGSGKLSNPTDIAIDSSTSNIIVLDRSNTVVNIFNSKYAYQRKLINVNKFDSLSNPLFLTISPRGNIVLSDLLTCSVNLFSMEGQLLWTLGGIQNKDTFGEPRGVTCDMMGRLVVVCNKDYGCLKIIQIHLPSLF